MSNESYLNDAVHVIKVGSLVLYVYDRPDNDTGNML